MQAVQVETTTTAPDTTTAPTCGNCGAVTYAGACMALGTCGTADKHATRGAGRDRAKATRGAFTIRGGVD